MMTDTMFLKYQQAQDFMQCRFPISSKTVNNDVVLPHWIKGSACFWYKRLSSQGQEFRLVDAVKATNERLFNHQVLADQLARATGKTVNADNLPISNIVMTLSPLQVRFSAFNQYWLFDASSKTLSSIADYTKQNHSPYGDDSYFFPLSSMGAPGPFELVSPDGQQAVYLQDCNLYRRDFDSGNIVALTTDGEKRNTYTMGGSGDDLTVPAVWSPNSRYVLALQWDDRKVEPFYEVVSHVPQDSILKPERFGMYDQWPFANAEQVTMQRFAVVDTHTGELFRPDYPDSIAFGASAGVFRLRLAWWSSDNCYVYFVEQTRGWKIARVVRWELDSGKATVVFEESSETLVKLCHEPSTDNVIFHPLPETNELIWFSERSGWAHLYLYDLTTGEVKNEITSGNWLVRDLLHVDPDKREVIIQTAGRDPQLNPYYRDICKVNMDTGELTTLATGDVDHNVCKHLTHWAADEVGFANYGYSADSVIHGVSPCGRYIVSINSRVDCAPETVLLDRDGHSILSVETADVSGFPDSWHWPEPVKTTSADGKTDIYGVVFRPPGYSPDKKYPVVEFCCGWRGFSWIPQGSFDNGLFSGMVYYRAMALSALGFIVVAIAGRGSPLRHRAFLDHHHGHPYYNGDFDDRIAAMRQLAERDPAMDLDRVGTVAIESFPNTIYAPLKHADFYKVTVMHCFSDPRAGIVLYHEAIDGAYNPPEDVEYPEDCVEGFDGKLLLIHGMLSPFVTPMFRLVDALEKAGKDFDMLCLPNMAHAMTHYTVRREWDYLVTHLLGEEPPKAFPLETSCSMAIEVMMAKAKEKAETKQ